MHSALFSKKDFGAETSAAAVGESEGVEADDVGEVKVSGCTGGGVWDGLGEAEAESVLDGADEEGVELLVVLVTANRGIRKSRLVLDLL